MFFLKRLFFLIIVISSFISCSKATVERVNVFDGFIGPENLFIKNNLMLVSDYSGLIVIDLASGEKKLIFDANKNGYDLVLGITKLNGYCYFLTPTTLYRFKFDSLVKKIEPEIELIMSDFSLANGIAHDGTNIFITDTEAGLLYKLTPAETDLTFIKEPVAEINSANGLRYDVKNKRFIVGSLFGSKIFAVYPNDMEDEQAKLELIAKVNMPDDLFVLDDGTIYCTSYFSDSIYRLDPVNKNNQKMIRTGVRGVSSIYITDDFVFLTHKGVFLKNGTRVLQYKKF